MKAASVNELKHELVTKAPAKLVELCLRLARFKKENKELLTYLLFEAHDLDGYISGVKKEMDNQLENINKSNIYFVKKTLRKVLRTANKFIRYSGSAIAETELRLYFCALVRSLNIKISKHQVILNMYQSQLKKIRKSISTLHEDLQYDYNRELTKISE